MLLIANIDIRNSSSNCEGWTYQRTNKSYLFTRFEDVTFESITATVTGDVTKNFQVVTVMGDIEYPEKQSEMHAKINLFFL